jgi:hypothetical protein
MSEIKDGGPAFPKAHDPYPNCQNTVMPSTRNGMTLRDYFAGQALPAIVADAMRHNAEMIKHDGRLVEWEDMADKAYVAADVMLKARGQ